LIVRHVTVSAFGGVLRCDVILEQTNQATYDVCQTCALPHVWESEATPVQPRTAATPTEAVPTGDRSKRAPRGTPLEGHIDDAPAARGAKGVSIETSRTLLRLLVQKCARTSVHFYGGFSPPSLTLTPKRSPESTPSSCNAVAHRSTTDPSFWGRF